MHRPPAMDGYRRVIYASRKRRFLVPERFFVMTSFFYKFNNVSLPIGQLSWSPRNQRRENVQDPGQFGRLAHCIVDMVPRRGASGEGCGIAQ